MRRPELIVFPLQAGINLRQQSEFELVVPVKIEKNSMTWSKIGQI
jgi:hypothetical protein